MRSLYKNIFILLWNGSVADTGEGSGGWNHTFFSTINSFEWGHMQNQVIKCDCKYLMKENQFWNKVHAIFLFFDTVAFFAYINKNIAILSEFLNLKYYILKTKHSENTFKWQHAFKSGFYIVFFFIVLFILLYLNPWRLEEFNVNG